MRFLLLALLLSWWIPFGLPEFDGGFFISCSSWYNSAGGAAPARVGATAVGREEALQAPLAPFILPLAGK